MTPRRWVPAAAVGLFALSLAASFRAPKYDGGFDVAAFARTPVLSTGRIKPLDTVARTSLLMIRGKQTVRTDDGLLDASQWLAELLSDPETADGRKVFAIVDPDVLGLLGKEQKERYFSLRDLAPFLGDIEAQAQHAGEIEAPQRSRFQSAVLTLQQRISLYQRLRLSVLPPGADDLPADMAAFAETLGPGMKALGDHQTAAKFDREALQELFVFVERYRFMSGAADFHPLPPPQGEAPDRWSAMGDGLLAALSHAGRMHPGAEAFAAATSAYRKRDAAAFNKAVADWGARLADRAPRAARKALYETWFNRCEPFYRGMVIYVVVFLLTAVSWLRWREVLRRTSFALLLLAFGIHTVGLVSRMVLQGRPPVTNLYSSAIFVGWAAVLLGIVMERWHRKGFGSAVAAAIGFVTLIIAHHMTGQGDTLEMMRAVLDSNFWLATHVVTITIGYSSTYLAAALAHVYIFRRWPKDMPRTEADDALAQMTYGTICFSLLLSFVGTVLGGIWADQSWGRFWGWDPKENGALLIVLWNAVILHARWGNYAGERGVMVMAVFGGIITSLSWFGVNMLGIGLHSYGFMDKAFLWLAAFTVLELAVMVLGSLPSRDRKRTAT
jgi:ABC-type transport system involved in cytochrome c biogenesis permease subunit